MRAPADGRACCLRLVLSCLVLSCLVLSCLCCLSVANVPARFACCAIVSGRGMFARRVLSARFAGVFCRWRVINSCLEYFQY